MPSRSGSTLDVFYCIELFALMLIFSIWVLQILACSVKMPIRGWILVQNSIWLQTVAKLAIQINGGGGVVGRRCNVHVTASGGLWLIIPKLIELTILRGTHSWPKSTFQGLIFEKQKNIFSDVIVNIIIPKFQNDWCKSYWDIRGTNIRKKKRF